MRQHTARIPTPNSIPHYLKSLKNIMNVKLPLEEILHLLNLFVLSPAHD